MAKFLRSDTWLFQKRYVIGYLLIVATFVALLFFAGAIVPGGISEGEKQSVVTAANLDLQDPASLAVPSLPYYVLQRGVIELFGVSTFSIKLPSLILAFFAGIGAVFLLRRWFKPNIALLAAVIMITTGQFLYVAQSGTPNIMFILWSVWLLLTATLITTSPRYARLWKVLFFVIVPLSLYTPLSVYLVLAIVSAGLIHPHVRYVIRRMPKKHLVMFMTLSLLVVLPLLYLAVQKPALVPQLLGLPSDWPPNVISNAGTLLQQYVNFIAPQSGTVMTPVFGLGSIALIVLGLWRLGKISYTARSYTMVAWAVMTLPILIINPTNTTIIFVPLLILMASGLEFLLRSWYGIFPRNPYARFVGLIPLVILVGGLVASGVNRYFYGYSHDPLTASHFSQDLNLLEKQIAGNASTTLIVTKAEKDFYLAVDTLGRDADDKLVVTTNTNAAPNGQLMATKAAHAAMNRSIERIVTSPASENADRFYVYKK